MLKGVSWLDVRIGLRMLVKYPALTLVGGLGMAVAIAVSVGFFAFAGAQIYPTLPLEEGDRIVALENRDVVIDNEERRALHDFVLWRDELKSVVDLGAFTTAPRNLIPAEGPPEVVRVVQMTASGFKVARVPPRLGRYLIEADERPDAPAVIVIGHDVWQRRFAGDPAVVGRELRLGAVVHTVVGVMPEGFGFPMSDRYWTPLRVDPAQFARRTGPSIFIFGRLAPGATMEAAQAELDVIGKRTAAQFPESNGKLKPMVMPYVHSLTDIQGISHWAVVQMQLMVSLLLVVVALNVAVLVYARTATRQGEIAVRTALGASRRRIVAQLFVEAFVLALGAAAVGLGIAAGGVHLANQIMETEMSRPFWADYSLKPATVLFTLAVALLAAMIVGVLPALQSTGRTLQTSLRQLGGGTGMRLGRTWTVLIVAQVAIAVAALPAAVSMGWSEIRSATTRPTYQPEEFLMANLRPESAAAAEERGASAPGAPTAIAARVDSTRFSVRLTEVLRRLEADPRVAGVTFEASLPGRSGRIEVEGLASKSASGFMVSSVGAAPDFLQVYGAPIVAGRGFGAADTDTASSAVIVNQAFVRQVLGGERALGRRLRYIGAPEVSGAPRATALDRAEPGRWLEIVGVAADLEVNPMEPELVRPEMMYAVGPEHVRQAQIGVRMREGASPADFAPRLREIVVAVDPSLLLGGVRALGAAQRQEQLALRLVGLVVSLVLVSVFLLSAAGVYALTSFTVTRRRREIGIRSALGANPRQVLRAVFARVAWQVALGMAVGLVGAGLLDVASGGEVLGGRGGVLLPVFAVLMAIVALLAAFGPARRGLRIEPSEALRAEA